MTIHNNISDITGIQKMRRQLRGLRNPTSLPFKFRKMTNIKSPYSRPINNNIKLNENTDINNMIILLFENQFSGIGNSSPIGGRPRVVLHATPMNRSDFVGQKNPRTSDPPKQPLYKNYHRNTIKMVPQSTSWRNSGIQGN